MKTAEEVKTELQALLCTTPIDCMFQGPEDPYRYPPYVRGCSREILEWFDKFNDILLENIQTFDQDRKVVLLTVCSYAKPYSNSFIHYGIRKALFEAGLLGQVEYWHLSSAGVIPSCLEEEVPYCCYDWNNENASEYDLKALREYLEAHYLHWLKQYVSPLHKHVVTYFRRHSNTQQAIKRVTYHPEGTVGQVQLDTWCQPLHQQDLVTLGGAYTDPDCMLLDRDNLARLTTALIVRCGV